MLTIHTIPAFNDNYIWLIEHNKLAYVVDPGDAQAVTTYLAKHPHLTLTGILITHHHHDHTGGINELCRLHRQQLHVYGPDNNNIANISFPISFNDNDTKQIHLTGIDLIIKAYKTPGHTLDHICYHIEDKLFCGDTLFSGGCGRLFEGNALQMHQSLQRLASLDDNTQVYCAHEYTQANLDFALHIDPLNNALVDYQQRVTGLRQQGISTLPSTIGLEKQINPFLRTDNQHIQHCLQLTQVKQNVDKLEVFTQLRLLKDSF
ncbi:hydroxyacylglutathione hydrolase [Shewanella intestini]|uniref:Hydroxyacylglutathione hydrolase n=1 Tax=Shewanella intestini TaxID=2017544 RepID=A0ABS5I1I7_9GAMM|nr:MULTISPECIES: hydroxyacylglutathione hydrolase [Shewanella]MBR9727867.1 hydroxyacylglutathione hydrolase [Shewanella intestini]MRG36140.1 hydroxyacylglutathione hydrolase [Shewanella sp. XMDDZSB0408]